MRIRYEMTNKKSCKSWKSRTYPQISKIQEKAQLSTLLRKPWWSAKFQLMNRNLRLFKKNDRMILSDFRTLNRNLNGLLDTIVTLRDSENSYRNTLTKHLTNDGGWKLLKNHLERIKVISFLRGNISLIHFPR